MSDQPQRDIVEQMQRMFNAGVTSVLQLTDEERIEASACYAGREGRSHALNLARIETERAIIHDLHLPANCKVPTLTSTCQRMFDEGAKAVLRMSLKDIRQAKIWHESQNGMRIPPSLQKALIDTQERIIAELTSRDTSVTGSE